MILDDYEQKPIRPSYSNRWASYIIKTKEYNAIKRFIARYKIYRYFKSVNPSKNGIIEMIECINILGKFWLYPNDKKTSDIASVINPKTMFLYLNPNDDIQIELSLSKKTDSITMTVFSNGTSVNSVTWDEKYIPTDKYTENLFIMVTNNMCDCFCNLLLKYI